MDMAELKRKSVRGGAVTIASQAITIAVQLASTVMLARLLSPADYGIIAMVTAITSFAGLFRDLGLSSAAIQKDKLTRAQQSNLFWLNVIVGGILTLIVAAGAPLVVWFYAKPELYWVTVALSANFLISSFGSQHGAMLVRNMQFTRRAIATITGSLVTLAAAVTFGVLGYSYWSLVLSSLAGASATTALLCILSPFRPGLMSRGSGVRDMLKFGASITAFDFVNYFHRNLDNILIGRLAGAIELGFYSRAYSLLMMPISQVRAPINAVGFPVLSRLQEHPAEFRLYFLQALRITAALTMPLACFLFISSKPLIHLLLGPGWGQVSVIFSILAWVAFIQPSTSLTGMLMLSLRLGGRYLKVGFLGAALACIAFIVGVHWGAIGVARSYAIVTYLSLIPIMLIILQGTPVSIGDFFMNVADIVVISLSGAVGALTLLALVTADTPTAQLVLSAAGFALAIVVAALILPKTRGELRSIAQSINRKRLSHV